MNIRSLYKNETGFGSIFSSLWKTYYLTSWFHLVISILQDIHYLAQDKGELALAEVAKKKADEIHADTLASQQLYEEELGLRESDEGSEVTYSSEEEYAVPAQRPHITSGHRANKPLPPLPPGSSEEELANITPLHRQDYVYVFFLFCKEYLRNRLYSSRTFILLLHIIIVLYISTQHKPT